MISEEEYQLEIDNDTFEYNERLDPGAYNLDITGSEDDILVKISRLPMILESLNTSAVNL